MQIYALLLENFLSSYSITTNYNQPLIKEIFAKYLLCDRTLPRTWDLSQSETKAPALKDLSF